MQGIFAPGLFQGKVIVVTGAAGGVGTAVARLLGDLGAQLVLTDLEGMALDGLAEDGLPEDGLPEDGATRITANLRQVADCEAVVAAALAAHGRIDGLVNAAGVWVEGPSEQATEEDWARCVDVNLKGSFFMCARAIPALMATQGAIVNIASDAGVTGNAGAAIYCASKGGVVVMTKALARELAPVGVRVNAICPSDIDTPMLAYQADRYGEGAPEAYLARLRAHYPQGAASRFLSAPEVAAQVAFLLSPASAGVTGAAVMVDFGLTAGY